MNHIFVVAKYTFVDVYRSKVMNSLFFLAIGLIVLTYVASEFAYGAPAKVALDFGFGITSIINLVLAIFIGANILSKEIEQKTLYMILSRKISRTSFLIGKILGLSSVLVINSISLGVLSIFIHIYLGGSFQGLMIWAIIFSLTEAFIILLFSVLFSLITNSTMAIIYSIGVFIVGHALNETSKTFFVKTNLFFKSIIDISFLFVPSLYKLNLKDFLLYKQSIDLGYLLGVQFYSILYICAIALFISLIFKNRNLD